jgi:DNA-binding protein H-NS
MPKLADLLAQKATLEEQIAKAQKEERGAAIAQARALIDEYGLSAAELGIGGARKTKPATAPRKVAPKYRDKATGQTWSGRGLQPRWLKAALESGKKLGDFAV